MNRFIIFCSCVIVAAILVATTYIASLLSSSNDWPLNDAGVPIVIVQADEMLEAGSASKAIAHIQPFLDDYDRSTPWVWHNALLVKARALVSLEDNVQAVYVLDELISDRNLQEVWARSGVESSESYFLETAYMYRFMSLFDSKNYEKALRDIEHLLKADPLDWKFNYRAGLTYLRLGNLNRSLDYLNICIEGDLPSTRTFGCLLTRAEVFVYLGEFEKAMKDVNETERLASPDPGELIYVFNRKGFVLNSFQQYSEAIIALNDAIANDPAYASPYYHRAVANSFLGNLEQAQADFDKALELGYDPDSATQMYPSLEPFSTNVDTSGGTSGNSTAGTISDTVAKSLSAGSSSLTQPPPNPADTSKVSESTPKSSSSAPATAPPSPSPTPAPIPSPTPVYGDEVIYDESFLSRKVTFSDLRLDLIVRELIGKPRGEPIVVRELRGITKLDLSDKGIREFSGIESMVDLVWLNLHASPDNRNNQPLHAVNMEVISSLKNLTFLDMCCQAIEDLSFLESLVNLEELHLHQNHISYNHLQPLKSLVKLKVLGLGGQTHSGGGFEDLTPISHLVNLEELNLSNNFIVDLEFLKPLVKIEELGLDQNSIEDLSPLKTLSNLKVLRLQNNPIADISTVEELIYTLCNLNYLAITRPSHLSQLPNPDFTIACNPQIEINGTKR